MGVERNVVLLLFARLRARIWRVQNRVVFICGDMFKVDISEASHFYCYLLPAAMAKLLPIFERSCNKVRIVSRSFPIVGKQYMKKVLLEGRVTHKYSNDLYTYEFNPPNVRL